MKEGESYGKRGVGEREGGREVGREGAYVRGRRRDCRPLCCAKKKKVPAISLVRLNWIQPPLSPRTHTRTHAPGGGQAHEHMHALRRRSRVRAHTYTHTTCAR